MAILINTEYSSLVTSSGINSKFNDVIGGNVIMDGFDVSSGYNNTVSLSPGKCIILGACIEEDSDSMTLKLTEQQLTKSELSLIIRYDHRSKRIYFEAKDTTENLNDNELVVASAKLESGRITEIIRPEKTMTLSEIDETFELVNCQLSNAQELKYSGQEIKCVESFEGKTNNMNVRGASLKNAVLIDSDKTETTPVYHKECEQYISSPGVDGGYINGTVIEGETVQNFIKDKGNVDEAAIADMSGLNKSDSFEINDSKAGKIGLNIEGETTRNLIEGGDEAKELPYQFNNLRFEKYKTYTFCSDNESASPVLVVPTYQEMQGEFLEVSENIDHFSEIILDEISGDTWQDVDSKNLCDPSKITPGMIVWTTGAVSAIEGYYVSEFIEIQPNKTYVFQMGDNNSSRYSIYDSSKAYITGNMGDSNKFQIVCGENAKYIRISGKSNSNVQLELGTTATEFVPYHKANLEDIRHVGKLYTDSDGNAILDDAGSEQYAIEIESSSKNLIPDDIKIYESYLNFNNDTGEIKNKDKLLNIDSEGFYISQQVGWKDIAITSKIRVVPGETYSVFATEKYFNRIYNRAVFFYDMSGNVIKKLWDAPSISSKYLLIPENVYFIRVQFSSQDNISSNHGLKIFMIKGEMPNNYDFDLWKEEQEWLISNGYAIEKQSSKHTLLLPYQLSKIGALADRLFWDSAKSRYVIEKNIGVTQLKGQDYNTGVWHEENTIAWFFTPSPASKDYRGHNGNLICDRFKWIGSIYGIDKEGCMCDWTTLRFRLFRSYAESKSELLNYLSENNFHMYYHLETPEIIDTNITKQVKLSAYDKETYVMVRGGDMNGAMKIKFPIVQPQGYALNNLVITPGDVTDIHLRIYGEGKINNSMLIEGDWTNRKAPKYFEGIMSTGEVANNVDLPDGLFEVSIDSLDTNIGRNYLNPNVEFFNSSQEDGWNVVRHQAGSGNGSGKYWTARRGEFTVGDRLYIRFNIMRLNEATYNGTHFCGRWGGYDTCYMTDVQYNDLEVGKEYIYSIIRGDSQPSDSPRDMGITFGAYNTPIEAYSFKFKNVIVMNLTREYGKGNEPTKEWCDENIIYFNDNEVHYKNYDKITYTLSEPLRKLPNGVCDEITEDGKLIRRTARSLFDESVVIEDYGVDNTGSKFILTNLPINIKSAFICNNPNIDMYGMLNSPTSYFYFKIPHTALGTTPNSTWAERRDKAREYLNNNETYLYYELVSPIIEDIEKPVLNTFDEITYINSDTLIKPMIAPSKGLGKNVLIKPNTQYTAYWSAKDGDDEIGIDVGGTKVIVPKTQNKVTLTTPAKLEHEKMYISGYGMTVKNLMLLDRDNCNDYIDGIESAWQRDDEKWIRSCGKNLFNVNGNINEAVSSINGGASNELLEDGSILIKNSSANTLGRGQYFYVKKNTDYRVKVDVKEGILWLGICNPNQYPFKYHSNLTAGSRELTFNSGNASKLGVTLATAGGSSQCKIENMMILEAATTATTYLPYQEDKKLLTLDAPLRRLNSAIYDSIEKKADKWCLVRRVGEMIIDGSEDFHYRINTGGASTGFIQFSVDDTDRVVRYHVGDNSKLKCDSLRIATYSETETSEYFQMVDNPAGRFRFYLNECNLSESTIDGFKRWLQENPTTVTYELATPQVIELDDNFDFKAFAEKTHIMTNATIKPIINVDSKFSRLVDIKPNTEYIVNVNGSPNNELKCDLGGWEFTAYSNGTEVKVTTPSRLSHNELRIMTPGVNISEVSIFDCKHKYNSPSGEIFGVDKLCIGSGKAYYRNDLDKPDVQFPATTLDDEGYQVIDHKIGDYRVYAKHTSLGYGKTRNKDKIYYRLSIVRISDDIVLDDTIHMISNTNGGYVGKVMSGKQFKELPLNEEVIFSKIQNFDAPNTDTRISAFSIGNYNREIKFALKFKEPIMLNLTYLYGAGNEPSKEWCDENIKFLADNEIHFVDGNVKNMELDEPLFSLLNGTCDEITADGTLVKRVGRVILDGSENWALYNDGKANVHWYGTASIPDLNISPNCNYAICDKLIHQNGHHRDKEGFAFGSDSGNQTYNNLRVGVLSKRLKDSTTDSFKQWLSENPVTILYELKEPIVSKLPISNINLKTLDSETIVTSATLVKPTLSFSTPTNLKGILRQTSDRVNEAEKLIDELLLPNLVETDYERTLLEFDFEVSKLSQEGDK